MTWGIFAINWLRLGEIEKAEETFYRGTWNEQDPFKVILLFCEKDVNVSAYMCASNNACIVFSSQIFCGDVKFLIYSTRPL
jgi:hypothetical protein